VLTGLLYKTLDKTKAALQHFLEQQEMFTAELKPFLFET
jgi:hypothetical protein